MHRRNLLGCKRLSHVKPTALLLLVLLRVCVLLRAAAAVAARGAVLCMA